MRTSYYYLDNESIKAIVGHGVQCNGLNEEPCPCCGLRCGHLEAIRKVGTFSFVTLSPQAIDEEYGYSSVDYCVECAKKLLEQYKNSQREVEKALSCITQS